MNGSVSQLFSAWPAGLHYTIQETVVTGCPRQMQTSLHASGKTYHLHFVTLCEYKISNSNDNSKVTETTLETVRIAIAIVGD